MGSLVAAEVSRLVSRLSPALLRWCGIISAMTKNQETKTTPTTDADGIASVDVAPMPETKKNKPAPKNREPLTFWQTVGAVVAGLAIWAGIGVIFSVIVGALSLAL